MSLYSTKCEYNTIIVLKEGLESTGSFQCAAFHATTGPSRYEMYINDEEGCSRGEKLISKRIWKQY